MIATEEIRYFNKAQLLEELEYDARQIKYSSPELRNDIDIGNKAMKKATNSLYWLSEDLQDNEEFLLKNLKNPIYGFDGGLHDPSQCISKRLRDDKEFVLRIMNTFPIIYRNISPRLRKDKEIYLAAKEITKNSPLILRRDYTLNLKKVKDKDIIALAKKHD